MGLHLPENLEALAATQREFEDEADQLAVQYLWNAGYDPNAYITLLEKLLQREKDLSGIRHQPSSWMQDTKDRITASAKERNQLPHEDQYRLNTPEFDRVKAQLQALGNRGNRR